MAQSDHSQGQIDPVSIDKLHSVANDAATQVGHLYVTFLLFGLYLAVTVGATTHEQLLRSAPVQLPLLNVQIPLFGFYWIAPFLFVLMHFNLLLQLHLLAQKLWRLDLAIERQIAPESARDAQRRLLHSFPFSHMLIGRHHRALVRSLLHVMIWITVIFVPVALLLGVQVRFLPYHDGTTTMWHRGLVVLDILLILVLWLRIVWGRDAWAVQKFRRVRVEAQADGPAMLALHRIGRVLRRVVAWSLLAVAIVGSGLASLFVLTFPGDPHPDFGDPIPEALSDSTQWRRPNEVFPLSNLEVTKRNLVTAWPTKEQMEEFGEDGAWTNFGGAVSLRDRDLRYGVFSRSTLAHANLQSTNLHGAVLDLANLQRADLAAANLQGADLLGANLQGANLQSAKLQGAELSGADLQGANLKSANLQGARLLSTNLQGARLGRANLQGSLLIDANLQGAGLDEVNLEGANLAGANLVAADLRGARLWWATVPSEAAQWSYADLRGTTVDRPLAEEIEAWKRAAQEITDESARDRVLEVLRRFEQILDLDGTPAFPVNWRTKADVLFDLDAHYAQGWADPLPIEAFDRSLAGHLIGLACTEETPPALAEGIAGRVYFEQKDERLYRAAVARSLVNGPCPPAEGLPRFMVARLKDLIRGAPAEAAPEGDAPVAGGPPAPAVAVEGEAPAGAPCSRAGESGRKE